MHTPNGVKSLTSSGIASVDFGALVISLDFELLWGVRDKYPSDGGAYRRNLLGVRTALPRMLDLFDEFRVAATWATVGFLFATSPDELDRFRPSVLPAYHNSRLFPYQERLGTGEEDDPLHFAPSLIEALRWAPRQELATHTFSHYYCLEPGQDRAAFKADLDSAIAIAAHRGIRLRSIVFPRNQINPDYLDVLVEVGLTCYRGNARGWMYRASAGSVGWREKPKRAGRMLDTYLNVSGTNVMKWNEVKQANGLCNVPCSRFLRPYTPLLQHLDALRLGRIARDMRSAACNRGLFHLWWHPHNFGIYVDENLLFLRRVLEAFADCQDRFGMRSLSMAEVVEVVNERTNRPAGRE